MVGHEEWSESSTQDSRVASILRFGWDMLGLNLKQNLDMWRHGRCSTHSTCPPLASVAVGFSSCLRAVGRQRRWHQALDLLQEMQADPRSASAGPPADEVPQDRALSLSPAFLGEGSFFKIGYRKKLVPTYSNLSTGGPRGWFRFLCCFFLGPLQKEGYPYSNLSTGGPSRFFFA